VTEVETLCGFSVYALSWNLYFVIFTNNRHNGDSHFLVLCIFLLDYANHIQW